jgi:antitoxin (DNA-binding transcriptional repressor) of toxin-antitoxin stability system
MTTLTATEARKNLTHWLKAAKNGQDIGIVYGADIFALRPVPVHAADYAQREYGVTTGQLEAFAARTDAELAAERKTGRTTAFTGKLPKRRAG